MWSRGSESNKWLNCVHWCKSLPLGETIIIVCVNWQQLSWEVIMTVEMNLTAPWACKGLYPLLEVYSSYHICYPWLCVITLYETFFKHTTYDNKVWGHNDQTRRPHIVEWDVCYLPKNKGGLSIKRPQYMNDAFSDEDVLESGQQSKWSLI
jgi:hypothetical protein